MKKKTVGLLVIGLLAFAPAASAAPFTVTVQGGIFGLEVLDCPSCGTGEYTVRYTADLTNFDSEVGNPENWDKYLNAIAFKVGGKITGASLTATDAGTPDNWVIDLVGWMDGSGSIGCDAGSANNLCTELRLANIFAAPTTGHSVLLGLPRQSERGGRRQRSANPRRVPECGRAARRTPVRDHADQCPRAGQPFPPRPGLAGYGSRGRPEQEEVGDGGGPKGSRVRPLVASVESP